MAWSRLETYVSFTIHHMEVIDLRADDSKDECTPWQITAVVFGICRSTCHIIARTVAEARGAVAVPRTSQTAVWPRQDRDRNEGSDKQDVQKNPDPAQRPASRIGALLDAAEQRVDECVEDRGSENTFDSTVCAVDAAAGLDGIDEAVHFVQTRREDA
jgi:hypothetical protein